MRCSNRCGGSPAWPAPRWRGRSITPVSHGRRMSICARGRFPPDASRGPRPPPSAAGREPVAQTAAVSPGYFRVMGIPLLRGRDFGSSERRGAPVALIVNQTFASRFFPGQDAIGQRVDAMRIPEMQDMTIVGVVGDTRRGGTLMGFTPEMYIAYAQFPQSRATLVV